MMKVASGADQHNHMAIEAAAERAIRRGTGTRTVFLNGGSDTRSAAIEYWREYARERNVMCTVYGRCMVIVGGRECE